MVRNVSRLELEGCDFETKIWESLAVVSSIERTLRQMFVRQGIYGEYGIADQGSMHQIYRWLKRDDRRRRVGASWER